MFMQPTLIKYSGSHTKKDMKIGGGLGTKKEFGEREGEKKETK